MSWWQRLKERCQTCSRVTLLAGVFVVALLVAGGLMAGGAAGLAWTNSEPFCISCHEMRDNPYPEYKDSVHSLNRTGVRATCSDCHVPREVGPMLVRKFQASFEVWGHLTGVIDTPEKFAANKARLAHNVWKRMKETDSLECRNCHKQDAWNAELQSDRSKARHAKLAEGKTCIDCHYGIAHEEPEGEGPQELFGAAH